MRSSYFSKTSLRPRLRRNGFTLVEVLVAVAIMSLLFAVILVPLRLGFDSFNIGQTRSALQQQAQLTLQQIGSDLRKAQFVFPNSLVAGVSDNPDPVSPCSLRAYKPDVPPVPSESEWNYKPYVISNSSGSTTTSWENPARIDMLQLRRSSTDNLPSDVGADYIVSYYSRRLDITKNYDAIDNPMVLFRAQYSYRSYSGGTFTPSSNVNIDWRSYPSSPSGVSGSGGFGWIRHNSYGEADLQSVSVDNGPTVGAHTLATPRGMALMAPRGQFFVNPPNSASEKSLVPELSFVQEATGGKRIDRVTINMTLTQYDAIGAASTNGVGKAQSVRVSQTFDLPSAGCSP